MVDLPSISMSLLPKTMLRCLRVGSSRPGSTALTLDQEGSRQSLRDSQGFEVDEVDEGDGCSPNHAEQTSSRVQGEAGVAVVHNHELLEHLGVFVE